MICLVRLCVMGLGLVIVAGFAGCKHQLPKVGGGLPDSSMVLNPDASAPDAGSSDRAAPDASPDLPVMSECPTGKHTCPGGCVSDTDPRTCGTSCTPCDQPTDGIATCDGKSCGGTCPTGKKLCQGACIDMGAPCAGGCGPGLHVCGNLCPSVMDVKACGTSCLPCPVPTGATQATCDGSQCDFTCTTGYHKCGARCAREEDANACGQACTVCPTDPNGTPQCVGGNCALACNTGYHLCGGRCVSNRDMGSCGTTSCTACQTPTGGSVTCDGTMCVPACPAGNKLCAGACIPTDSLCGTCATGTHDCGGICAPNTSIDSCGTLCTACPKPTGASTTTCTGNTCDFTCSAGTHRCGTGAGARCAADNDATGCGATCITCPTDPNGTAACVGGMCALMCKTGFHVCGGKCVDNKALATCGPNDDASCMPCPVPTGGGTASCDGLACASSCPTGMKVCLGACIPNANACMGMCLAGQHNCNGICQPDTSTTQCGVSCVSCPAPSANGSASCTNGACAIACNTGFKRCPNTNLCIPNAGCCASADCTGGPANTTGVCGTANTCSFPCATGFKMCGSACIANASCCTNSDCMGAGTTCGGTCQTNGTCSYPTGTCGTASCSGTSRIGTGTCSSGTCVLPAPMACASGFTCSGAGLCSNCAGGFKACGTTCIPTANCCTNDDCIGKGVAPCGGTCAANGACSYPAATVTCGAATCSGSNRIDVGHCSTGLCAFPAAAACPIANEICTGAGVCTCVSPNKLCNGACISGTACCTNADCAGSPATCNGTCGANGVCSFTASNGAVCQAATCSGVNRVPERTCSNGTCPMPASMGCMGNLTCTGAGVCTCAAPNKTCPVTGACIPSAACCTDQDCPGANPNCPGTCGTNGVCSFTGTNGAVCGSASCSGINQLPAPTCLSGACPAKPAVGCGGNFVCSGLGSCNTTCATNFKLCAAACVACTAPANATTACNGAACDFTCNQDFKRCGNVCIPSTGCCDNAGCTAPETCGGGGVANKCSCPMGSQLCTLGGARSCGLATWTFEGVNPNDFTDHTQGWGGYASNNNFPSGSTLHPHGGSWAIFDSTANNLGQTTAMARFACDDLGLMDARGRTFQASVFVTASPAGTLAGTSCVLRAQTGPNPTVANPTPFAPVTITGGTRSPIIQGSYFTLTGTFPNTAPASEVYEIRVECLLPPEFVYADSQDSLGALSSFYIDDVSIN